jgi:hypothetical protein
MTVKCFNKLCGVWFFLSSDTHALMKTSHTIIEQETPSLSLKLPAIQSNSQCHNPPLWEPFLALLKHLVISVGQLHRRAVLLSYIGFTF